ncbi:MAG TPA: ATP synthase F0 subunit B [Bryobacteraceae bacterium]|nr:ATP synthase F0 subunit B [Bryobacteraceae bacterium]
MDVILRQLGELLLRAIPTFLLVVFLSYYLKFVFIRPLEKVLRQRYDATEGARKLAEEMLQRAAAKMDEYDAALRAARAEVYDEQERLHKRLQSEAAGQIAEARHRTEATIEEARQQIAHEAEVARASLERESDALADQIADAILRRSAA